MKISALRGLGFEAWLIERLASWGIQSLTEIQIRALEAGIANGQSMIVSAPTSSGKTLVGEIGVLTALRAGTRAIYLVSHKALADQKYKDFVFRFGEGSTEPIATVGLNTGDRAEGDIDSLLLVATYEKALGLLLSGQLNPGNSLIVADELQILGESGRGPEIETLCALLRNRGIKQFVALTATVQNSEDLAGWMNCALVRSNRRDVPLLQEIWFGERAYQTEFGQAEGKELQPGSSKTGGVTRVVEHLLAMSRGPILVFTESRREAVNYADAFEKTRPRSADGIAISDQLELFSEPTESSEKLRKNAEKRVAFHSADLSPQERQVIESGFSSSSFDVCFATSTLAAGVNFPFRTVVFSKLTYQWGDRSGSHIQRSEYRNMSGRAGRLGMHECGYAVLLPTNPIELAHAKRLVQPDNDPLISRLVDLSLRKALLALVASRIAANISEVMRFFENTLYWYQTLNNNPKKLSDLRAGCESAISWLLENGLLDRVDETLLVTPLGNAAAISGLLPATAVDLSTLLGQYRDELVANFDEWIPGLIYAICASKEFYAEYPSRFLPFPGATQHDSIALWASKRHLVGFDRADVRLAKCAHAVLLYIEGTAERKIAHATALTAGNIHRLAIDVAWILDGLHKISCVPTLGCTQLLSNQISLLSRRVRSGSPVEALDFIRLSERHNVPGLGRQRAMALVSQGISTLHDILTSGREALAQLLRNDRRAQALIDAASATVGLQPNRLANAHDKVAKRLGIDRIVQACNTELGTRYEAAVVELLQVETSWVVSVIDDGKRQNVPDILVTLAGRELLIECKTCTRAPSLIKKEEAWSIMQKAADFSARMHRVTLGKPQFDETSKRKAAASHDITLIEHHIFVEALLRVHAGTLSPQQFLDWLSSPGIADIDRLNGTPTYA